MYFEQKIVNGILCHRNDPRGEWIQYSQEDLTGMLQNYHRINDRIMECLAEVKGSFESTAKNLISMIYCFPY